VRWNHFIAYFLLIFVSKFNTVQYLVKIIVNWFFDLWQQVYKKGYKAMWMISLRCEMCCTITNWLPVLLLCAILIITVIIIVIIANIWGKMFTENSHITLNEMNWLLKSYDGDCEVFEIGLIHCQTIGQSLIISLYAKK